MIILGIDPGLATTGWGIIETKNNQQKVIKYGTIKTKPNKNLPLRLQQLHQEILSLITQHKPDRMAVEKVFFGSNAKSALMVGQARGVVLLCAAQKNLSVNEYAPLQIKIAITSYGRAEKDQMQKMVKILLKLKKIPQPDDAADALAVALCDSVSKR